MIPTDLLTVLRKGLHQDKRAPDGLLHCSSDLVGSLRHAQLRIAGAPSKSSELVSDIRLMTGTMWHEKLNEYLGRSGIPFMKEINVTEWLPHSWGGTADWLFWNDARRAFVLGDLKTIKGEGLRYLTDGMKEEHIWQLSAYYHALSEAKFPLVKGVTTLYLPMNSVGGEEIEPIQISHMPLGRDQVWERMEERARATLDYISSGPGPTEWVTDALASTMPRVQKLLFVGKDKTNPLYEVKLVPHWTTMYCPYDDALCDCDTQGVTKIGAWEVLTDTYIPRKGFDSIEPTVMPNKQQIRFALKRAKEEA